MARKAGYITKLLSINAFLRHAEIATLEKQTTKTKRPADNATSTGLDFIVEI